MENEARIIMATEQDRTEILELYRMQVGREFCPWTMDYPSNDTITFDLKRDALFIIRDEEGRLIGAISLEDDPDVDALPYWSPSLRPGGELARLAVHPDSQNLGLAKKLLQFGMDKLKERGCRSVHFLVNRLNEKAIRSYAAFHFNVVGECFMFEQPFYCYEKVL